MRGGEVGKVRRDIPGVISERSEWEVKRGLVGRRVSEGRNKDTDSKYRCEK